MASSVLLNEAVLPAFERLGLQYLEIPKEPALVVPLTAQPPASGTLFLTIQANDEAGEALIHVQPCTARAARRPQLALLLAELNTQYRFITFSMTRDGEVRVDIALTFWSVMPEMRVPLVEMALNCLVHVMGKTYSDILRVAEGGRRRRPRVEREIDAVLRGLDQ